MTISPLKYKTVTAQSLQGFAVTVFQSRKPIEASLPTIVPSNSAQLNFSRWRHKSQASQLEITFASSPQPEAIFTIKSAGCWPGHYVIQIKHCELIWQLAPCLRFQEAEAILSTLQLLGVDLSLDQDESRSIAARQINRIVGIYLDCASEREGTI